MKPIVNAQFIASLRRECDPDAVFESENNASPIGRIARRICPRVTQVEGRSPAEEMLDRDIARKLSLKNIYDMGSFIAEQKVQIQTQQEAITLLQKQNKELNDELFIKTNNELQNLRVEVNLLKSKH